jgi:hypothetical protein
LDRASSTWALTRSSWAGEASEPISAPKVRSGDSRMELVATTNASRNSLAMLSCR